MGIRTIIWDLGGVLVRTEDFAPRDQLAARFGMQRKELSRLVFGDRDDSRAQMGEISHDEQWGHICKALGVPFDESHELEKQFFAGDRLDKDLMDYIRNLKTSYTTALLSNALSNLRQLILDEWKIDDAFHHLIISAEVGLMKPEPAIYELALEQSSSIAEEAIFIDDSLDNVTGARNVGMHAVHFQNPEQARNDLEELLQATD
ncbi:MAG: HAD family phosphatase [Chloroflexi bacterium]|nr:HAD family phosphatase [Chloroflexota bacterium]